jgi:protein-disulfide isomerase
MAANEFPAGRFKRDFWVSFLFTLLVTSLALNAALVLRLRNPDIIHQWLRPTHFIQGDHVRGDSRAPVTVIEYGDFQCPFCASVHPALTRLAEGKQIRWVFRNFPLDSHSLSRAAAEVAECSAEQGEFWQFADSMFIQQTTVKSRDDLKELALQAGVEPSSLNACLASSRPDERLQRDNHLSAESMVESTPTLFINGKRQVGAVEAKELQRLVDMAK